MPKHTAKKAPLGIKLGSLVMDRVTGFKGIAIGRTEFAYGCVHIRVQSQQLTKDGDPVPLQSFDDQRVDVIEAPARVWPEPKKPAFKLGCLVRDSVTKATGIATGRTIDLDGRVKYMIEQPGLTDLGEPKSPLLVIAERLEVVARRELKISESSAATSGGPMPRAPKTL